MKNLIFDIDGTLWNTTDVVATAWNRAVKECNVEALKDLHITGNMLKKEFGKPMDVIADDLFKDIDKDLKASILKKCCVYEHDEILACNDDLTYPKMQNTILELSKSHKLFIVSNCQDGYIELVMKKTGIEGVITDFECFGHTGLQKDENIELVIKRNKLDKNETVYIGDTCGDYEATKKAGIKFVFARYGFGDVETPDITVDSFDEILSL